MPVATKLVQLAVFLGPAMLRQRKTESFVAAAFIAENARTGAREHSFAAVGGGGGGGGGSVVQKLTIFDCRI